MLLLASFPGNRYCILYSMWQKAGEEPGDKDSCYNYTPV